jgi:hypothetical protein
MFKKFSVIFLGLSTLFLLSACMETAVPSESQEETKQENFKVPEIPQKEPETNKIPTSNKFKLEDVKVSDKIGDMTIVSVDPFSKFMDPNSNSPVSSDNVIIKYAGQIQVNGNYTYYKEGEGILADIVCMDNLDQASLAKFPIMEVSPGNERTTWFCFSNDAEAKKQFGPVGRRGKATVVIDEYTNVHYPTEAWDTAKLVKVVENSQL